MRYFHLPPVVSCARRRSFFGKNRGQRRGKQAEKRSCEARKPDGRRAGARAIGAVDRFERYARPRGHVRDAIATRARRAAPCARLDGGDARDLRAPALVP